MQDVAHERFLGRLIEEPEHSPCTLANSRMVQSTGNEISSAVESMRTQGRLSFSWSDRVVGWLGFGLPLCVRQPALQTWSLSVEPLLQLAAHTASCAPLHEGNKTRLQT